MSRFLLSCFGGLVQGATLAVVVGALAASIFTKMPGGAREGGGAMAGLFLVGPMAGVVGLAAGGWIVWKLLASPERMGMVAIWLVVQLVALGIGTMIALQPTIVVRDDFEGKKAEFHVEVSFPAAQMSGIAKEAPVRFEMRSADGTEETPWLREGIRQEGERNIAPGVFAIRTRPRSKLLAVMVGEKQLMCTTLKVDGEVEGTTEWSAWQSMEEGFEARWRLVIRDK